MLVDPVLIAVERRPGLGDCATGCGEPAMIAVSARRAGISAHTYTCYRHRTDGEVRALRMLADMLEQQVAELRRDVSSRRVLGRGAGV